jgi:hypothetical protein
MNSDRAIDLALRCYPGWWQDRYADEVRVLSSDLTAEGRSKLAVTLNLMRGAIRARSRAQGMPKTHDLWSVRARVSIALATVPWLVAAPLALVAMGNEGLHSSEGTVSWSGPSFMPSNLIVMKHGALYPSAAPPLTPNASLVLWGGVAISLLVLFTFVILISGWSGLAGAIKRSSIPHRRRLRLLAWVPVLSLLTDLALSIAEDRFRPDHLHLLPGGREVVSGGNPVAMHALASALPAVAIVGWLVSVTCVAVAARKADISPSDLRFGKSVSVVVAALFAALVVAYAVWGAGLVLQGRQAIHGNFTTIGYSDPGIWPIMLFVLLIGAALSVMGARAASRSWKVISVTFDV